MRLQASFTAGSGASTELGLASRRGSLTSGEQFVVQRSVIGTGPGEDARTTVMIRNIPNKYSQKVLLATLDEAGFYGQYDFFYLPIDFKNGCNVGYAFLNLARPEVR